MARYACWNKCNQHNVVPTWLFGVVSPFLQRYQRLGLYYCRWLHCFDVPRAIHRGNYLSGDPCWRQYHADMSDWIHGNQDACVLDYGVLGGTDRRMRYSSHRRVFGGR